MKNLEETIVTFGIGRGGPFNNAGWLSYLDADNSAKQWVENHECFIMKEDADGNLHVPHEYHEDDAKLCLTSGSGSFVGYLKEDGEEFYYEKDTIYDTTYGKKLMDCNDREYKAIIRADEKKGWNDKEVVAYAREELNEQKLVNNKIEI